MKIENLKRAQEISERVSQLLSHIRLLEGCIRAKEKDIEEFRTSMRAEADEIAALYAEAEGL